MPWDEMLLRSSVLSPGCRMTIQRVCQIAQQTAKLLDITTRNRCEHFFYVAGVTGHCGSYSTTPFHRELQTCGPAVRLVRFAGQEPVALETFHDPGEVSGGDEQITAQLDERHAIGAAVQLGH